MPKPTIYTKAFDRASQSLNAGMQTAWIRAGQVPLGEMEISPGTALRRARNYNLLDSQGQAMRGMTRSIALQGGYGNQNPMGPDQGNKTMQNVKKKLMGQTDKNMAAGRIIDPSSQQIDMAASADGSISSGAGSGLSYGESS